MNAENVEIAALRLSLDEQAQIAKRLLLNLESSNMLSLLLNNNKNHDDHWKMLALKRSNAIDCGESIPIDGDVVKKALAKRLRDHRV